MLNDLVLFLPLIVVVNDLNTLFLLLVDLISNFAKVRLLYPLGLDLLLLAPLLGEVGRSQFAQALSWLVMPLVLQFAVIFLILFSLLTISDLLLNLLILSQSSDSIFGFSGHVIRINYELPAEFVGFSFLGFYLLLQHVSLTKLGHHTQRGIFVVSFLHEVLK